MARPFKPIENIDPKKFKKSAEYMQERAEGMVKALPVMENVTAPKVLQDSPELIAEFNTLSARLIDMGIFCDIDCDALARYIIAKQNYQKSQALVSRAFETGKTTDVKNATAIQNKFFTQCQDAAKALGLTPTSRQNISVQREQETEVNKFDEFLQ